MRRLSSSRMKCDTMEAESWRACRDLLLDLPKLTHASTILPEDEASGAANEKFIARRLEQARLRTLCGHLPLYRHVTLEWRCQQHSRAALYTAQHSCSVQGAALR